MNVPFENQKPCEYNICITEGERFGEWIECETKEQFEIETKKLIEQNIDFVVNPNW